MQLSLVVLLNRARPNERSGVEPEVASGLGEPGHGSKDSTPSLTAVRARPERAIYAGRQLPTMVVALATRSTVNLQSRSNRRSVTSGHAEIAFGPPGSRGARHEPLDP